MPKVEFEVSRAVNEFCHLSVLYSEIMPVELANGILRNASYQERYHRLHDHGTRLKLQKTGPVSSASEWYEFVTGLMERDKTGGLSSFSKHSGFAELFQGLRQRRALGFDEIWKETRPRLVKYMYSFQSLWTPISDRVLSKLRELAKAHWQTGTIRAHYVDCLYGGFAWKDSIGLTTLPDMDVQKKFLAHELSELITPQQLVRQHLQKEGLDLRIADTVVDLFAYFSVRDFLSKHDSKSEEKNGIRPSRRYYAEADVLYMFFERYAEDPMIYADFDSVIRDMISVLYQKNALPVLTD
ncbi:MAG TPA: hypothetical protein VE955_09770 [Candidatus Dormibacteraeota bacterium]|nr:hypothetical protein [Candidatus Dormibacteraeota bacterium]